MNNADSTARLYAIRTDRSEFNIDSTKQAFHLQIYISWVKARIAGKIDELSCYQSTWHASDNRLELILAFPDFAQKETESG
jgi:hypothetical protein